MVDAKPSKSALKRDDQALKVLGEALVRLNSAQLDQLPLEERLRDAIDAAQNMRAHGAIRRQRQLIGKLLRQSDAAAIRQGLTGLTADDIAGKRRFREAERLRDRLVEDGFDGVAACAEASGANADLLRNLLGQAAQARSDRAQKTARRELFRVIHAALDGDKEIGTT